MLRGAVVQRICPFSTSRQRVSMQPGAPLPWWINPNALFITNSRSAVTLNFQNKVGTRNCRPTGRNWPAGREFETPALHCWARFGIQTQRYNSERLLFAFLWALRSKTGFCIYRGIFGHTNIHLFACSVAADVDTIHGNVTCVSNFYLTFLSTNFKTINFTEIMFSSWIQSCFWKILL